MFELHLRWFFTIHEKKLRHVSRLLETDPSTVHKMLNKGIQRVSLETISRLNAETNKMREYSYTTDASFLLPEALDFKWRYATWDKRNLWRVYCSKLPPKLDQQTHNWMSDPGDPDAYIMSLDNLFLIPADADALLMESRNSACYQRCMITGLWYKVYNHHATPLPSPFQDETFIERSEMIKKFEPRYLVYEYDDKYKRRDRTKKPEPDPEPEKGPAFT